MDKKHTILIIDDDSFLLDMYALKFTQSGFEVATALGSEPALEKIAGGYTPDAILIDVVMPVINGFELIKKMNDEKISEKSLKIILSNRGQQSDIDEGNKLNIAGYIVKANTTPTEVIEKVKEMMKK